ncbi:MAG: GlsB/YeaQ/YmgE family stress response membrane protein [Nocardioidaceae bacterium]
MQILGLLVIGLVIGALARLIKPGKQRIGLLMTLLLGVGGAIIGGLVAGLFSSATIWEINFPGFVIGLIAAVVLIGVAEGSGAKKAWFR